MSQMQNTVFISYRRTNVFMARAIYQHLSANGFEVFFDYESIKAGDFSQIILKGIESHAHFLPLLTPSALERCTDPDDWVRREIEHAIQCNRNIIPLTMEGFDFNDIGKYMPHIADAFGKYNGVRIPADFFDAAMGKVINYMNQPLDTVLHPVTPQVKQFKQEQQQQVAAQPKVTEHQMSAEKWFEKGYQAGDVEHNYPEAIRYYTEAIRLKPDLPEAYNNRGLAYNKQGNYAAAIRDCNEAIRLKPDYAQAYNNRGLAYHKQDNNTAAIRDYNQAIQLEPDDALAYYNRGLAYHKQGNYVAAIHDYNQAIRLKPDYAEAYTNRGGAYKRQGDYAAAIRDYSEVIRLEPHSPVAYYNRGLAYHHQNHLKQAIKDYEAALRIDPNFAAAKKNLDIARSNRKRRGGRFGF